VQEKEISEERGKKGNSAKTLGSGGSKKVATMGEGNASRGEGQASYLSVARLRLSSARREHC